MVTHFCQSSIATLLNPLRNALRTKHYSYETEKAYVYWVNRFVRFHPTRNPEEITDLEIQHFLTFFSIQELLGHNNVKTTMVYTHVLNKGGLAVKSPADRL